MSDVMTDIPSVSALIALWPTRQSLSDDINRVKRANAPKVTVDRVHKWAQGNSIPAKYHSDVLTAATFRGFPVDAKHIIEMHRLKSEAA